MMGLNSGEMRIGSRRVSEYGMSAEGSFKFGRNKRSQQPMKRNINMNPGSN